MTDVQFTLTFIETYDITKLIKKQCWQYYNIVQIILSITCIPFEGDLFMSANFCYKCGTALKPNAKFCSASGVSVYRKQVPQTSPVQESQAPVHSLNIQTQAASIQNAVLQTGSLTNAPLMGGKFAIDIAPPVNEVTKTIRRRFGITNILAGLAAGDTSFAAIWSFDSPAKLSIIISALAIVLCIMLSLIRRRHK